MSGNVLVLPVTAIDREEARPPSPQEDLLWRMRGAYSDCVDDEKHGTAKILEEARSEIIRLQAVIDASEQKS